MARILITISNSINTTYSQSEFLYIKNNLQNSSFTYTPNGKIIYLNGSISTSEDSNSNNFSSSISSIGSSLSNSTDLIFSNEVCYISKPGYIPILTPSNITIYLNPDDPEADEIILPQDFYDAIMDVTGRFTTSSVSSPYYSVGSSKYDNYSTFRFTFVEGLAYTFYSVGKSLFLGVPGNQYKAQFLYPKPSSINTSFDLIMYSSYSFFIKNNNLHATTKNPSTIAINPNSGASDYVPLEIEKFYFTSIKKSPLNPNTFINNSFCVDKDCQYAQLTFKSGLYLNGMLQAVKESTVMKIWGFFKASISGKRIF